MSLITGEKTTDQLRDMRECGRMLATIYDELKLSTTNSLSCKGLSPSMAGLSIPFH